MAMHAFSTLGCSGATVAEVLALAERHSCSGVELRVAPDEPIHTLLTRDERTEVRKRLKKSGVRVLSLASYVRICGHDDIEVELTAQLFLALDLGADGVRVFPGDPEPAGALDADLTTGERRAIERIGAAAELASELGVKILVESHDSHSAGSRLAILLGAVDDQVGPGRVQAIWDAAHTWRAGESPAQTVGLMRPWIAYLQVKDTDSTNGYRPVFPGQGDYPIADLMTAADPDWALSLEWERKWHPELAPLEKALPATWSWIEAARQT